MRGDSGILSMSHPRYCGAAAGLGPRMAGKWGLKGVAHVLRSAVVVGRRTDSGVRM